MWLLVGIFELFVSSAGCASRSPVHSPAWSGLQASVNTPQPTLDMQQGGFAGDVDLQDDSLDIEREMEKVGEVAAKFEKLQEESLKVFDEIAKQQVENEKLTAAIEAAIPDAKERRQITARSSFAINQFAEKQGWTQQDSEEDNNHVAGGGNSMDIELGSSPVEPMAVTPPQDTGRLRGGGRCARLRGGGNVLSVGSGYTPEERTLNKKLCKAVGLGDNDSVRALVKQGADPSYKGCSMLDFSVAHHGVHKQQMESVELLKRLGADVHAQDKLGWTLLHQAAHNGDVEAVDRLVKWGLDVTVKNNAGRTPAAVAKTAGAKECYKRLMQLQVDAMPTGDAKLEMKAKADAAAQDDDDDDDGDEDDDDEEEEKPPVKK
eukprot:CAMPEP_0202811970 /NCGR_PEP_ID=MMETSP1389-20130828/3698_1 /ASSEMBLY_ACC=CAM_ASM_000865 /TAXON_ID=302021 /ORGANISM="Rhodomonas sp., Strain CCMP768" /LENGTH=375 /DNA_ID=CAMNT_0049483229 /DNA_START=90 /DNA_END=1217 /DNA_ORIENTATION=+